MHALMLKNCIDSNDTPSGGVTLLQPVPATDANGVAESGVFTFERRVSYFIRDTVTAEDYYFYPEGGSVVTVVIKDNRNLDVFYVEAEKFFSTPSITAVEKPMYFAITIHDALFRETVAKINENISLLQLLIPMLYVLSAGIGFLSGFLFMRGRTREFAVMRSLGLSRFKVALLSFAEQLFIGTIGIAPGILLCLLATGGGNAINSLLFTAIYLAGALVSVLWITNVNTMQLLKSED
ncbi:MAG: ABC transporter permease [Clostridiales bacterium]|nr:ABC transporter permease [Clostridiales bacterium]